MAPTAALFSHMPGSLVYDKCPGKASLSEVFDISEDVLTGSDTDRNKTAAVGRLVKLLSDPHNASVLATTLVEQVTERMQFLHIANSLLKVLTPVMTVNANLIARKYLSKTPLQSKKNTWGSVTT